MPGSLRFNQAERLTSRVLIGRLFSDGLSVHSRPLRLVWLSIPTPHPFPVQVLFAVPTSRFKRATDRNRVRRQLREIWRLRKSSLYAELKDRSFGLAIAVVFTGRALPSFEELERGLDACLRKLLDELENINDAAQPGDNEVDH